MKTQVMTIRDVKVEAFNQPFCTASVGMAIRSFTDAVNGSEKNTDISKHAADFDLFHLGSYDDSSATFDLFPQPKHILNGEGAKNV